MRKTILPVLLFVSFCWALAACSNGDYVANPSSNANGSINPLNPLKSTDFTWKGIDPVSAKINGSQWVADSAIYYLDTNGANRIIAFKGNEMLSLAFLNTWQGNLYNMGFKQYNVYGLWYANLDSLYSSHAADYAYLSVLGNSGEMLMIENDSVNFVGKFYFQGVNDVNGITNLSEGYFNLRKFP